MSESYAELLERLEDTKRTLRGALVFINDNSHLTDEGIVAQEALLGEIEAIEQDLEAIRQERKGCPDRRDHLYITATSLVLLCF